MVTNSAGSDLEPQSPFAPIGDEHRPSAPRVFSVPRRYDIATLMAVCMAYGCLFGLMRACGASQEMMMWTAGFLTAVGLAQAVFLGGKSPRVSSMIGGILFTEAALLLGWATGAFGTGLAGLLPIMLVAMIEGAILGYAAGTLVGGVFLVAHLLRRMVGGSRR